MSCLPNGMIVDGGCSLSSKPRADGAHPEGTPVYVDFGCFPLLNHHQALLALWGLAKNIVSYLRIYQFLVPQQR